MKRSKTLLSADEQWKKTVEYYTFTRQTGNWLPWTKFLRYYQSEIRALIPSPSEPELRKIWETKCGKFPKVRDTTYHPTIEKGDCLWVANGTHRVFVSGDLFIVTLKNGMTERYGMTGVTSKGVRLNGFHLPLRNRNFEVELPDDFIGMQWNDPAVGRYVADLRASRRNRVSAYSPVYSHCKTTSGIDTSEVTSFGLYKSGRLSRTTRKRDYRNYIRFYPDGSVVMTTDFNHQGSSISFEPERTSPKENTYHPPMQVICNEDGSISFERFDLKNVFQIRYTGKFENGRLWLSWQHQDGSTSEKAIPYRFHPFTPNAYLDGQ